MLSKFMVNIAAAPSAGWQTPSAFKGLSGAGHTISRCGHCTEPRGRGQQVTVR